MNPAEIAKQLMMCEQRASADFNRDVPSPQPGYFSTDLGGNRVGCSISAVRHKSPAIRWYLNRKPISRKKLVEFLLAA